MLWRVIPYEMFQINYRVEQSDMERSNKEAVKMAEPEIVRNYVDKLHRYLNRFKEGKMTKEAAAKKLDMTLAQFDTLFC